jgi:hypothetical protein
MVHAAWSHWSHQPHTVLRVQYCGCRVKKNRRAVLCVRSVIVGREVAPFGQRYDHTPRVGRVSSLAQVCLKSSLFPSFSHLRLAVSPASQRWLVPQTIPRLLTSLISGAMEAYTGMPIVLVGRLQERVLLWCVFISLAVDKEPSLHLPCLAVRLW